MRNQKHVGVYEGHLMSRSHATELQMGRKLYDS